MIIHLRRPAPGSETSLPLMRFNGCSYLDSKRSLDTPAGDEIRLRAKTCKVFELLASKTNRLVTRDELANHVWGETLSSLTIHSTGVFAKYARH